MADIFLRAKVKKATPKINAAASTSTAASNNDDDAKIELRYRQISISSLVSVCVCLCVCVCVCVCVFHFQPADSLARCSAVEESAHPAIKLGASALAHIRDVAAKRFLRRRISIAFRTSCRRHDSAQPSKSFVSRKM